MCVEPSYPIWKLHAECPICRGMIHRTDDRADLPGVMHKHGIKTKEDIAYEKPKVRATWGLAPPTTVPQEWRCPHCGKRWDELAWEYK